jgi:phosphohistidine phosphatase SixA
MKRSSHGSGAFYLAVMVLLGMQLVQGSAVKAADLPAMIVLVRHAEKAANPPDDPHLTAEGAKRARDLAAAVGAANLTAIVTTQLLRTRETAQPAATAFGLTINPIQVDPEQPDAHVNAMLAALRKQSGGSVLVVGHSNTVPKLIQALGGPHLPEICESVYDRLFVVTPTPGKTLIVQSRYGAPSTEQNCN